MASREIPSEGLHRDWHLSGEWIRHALSGTEAEGGPASLTAEVDLTRSGDEIYAHGSMAGAVTVACSRCLAATRVNVDGTFDITFIPAGGGAPAADIEIPVEVADVKAYADDEVDLEDTLREELIMALPIAAVCRETCRGLCARCGKDLNEGPCDCPPEPKDDRWAALKNVKL